MKETSHCPPIVLSTELLLACTSLARRISERPLDFLARVTHLTLAAGGSKKQKGAKIDRLTDVLTQCPKLKVLYLYENALEKIEHLEFASKLTHLYLQNNHLCSLTGLSCLVNLTKLSVAGNALEMIHGLEKCTKLEELHVSNQQLDRGSHLCFDPETTQALVVRD